MADLSTFFNRVRDLFGKRFSQSEADAPLLRDTFRDHYRIFRSLLTANNNALELMAEMEEILSSGRPFGMTFVRSRCTALSFQVYKMIQRLQELSGDKYSSLTGVFKAISARMEEILARPPKAVAGPFILEMAEIDRHSADQVGEKMANLGEIANRAGFRVPDGFVITAAAAQHFLAAGDLRDEINRRLTVCDPDNLEDLYTASAAIHQLITTAPLPEELERQIMDASQRLIARSGGETALAVRSSALGEDGGNASFAGQYRTQLHVGPDLLIPTYKEIVAGKYKSQAIVYRLQRGFRHQDVIMAVGCLAMVDAAFGGVAYSRSPTDLRCPHVVISAVPGLAGQVVDGRAETDLFLVAREAPHAIISQRVRQGSGSGGLSADHLRELARTAVRLEAHFGTPQDVEWSIDRQGRLILLQSRPLVRVSESTAQDPRLSTGGESPASLLEGAATASPGVGSGPAFIVRSAVDLLRFPKGAVLVVEHPLPDWATLLPRAAAVISETGQVAAHLATVAREFGLPALFGVKGATTALADKQIVTVDATGGRIYDGRREELLGLPHPLPNLMKGSPVYKVLERVLALAAPLNLTDPASPFFRPSSCRTLHDLTRFCHEKAVSEMFSFGTRFRFDEKAAKQLVDETPFQWWIIDLDDGFSQDYDRREKFVHVSQIVSAPMLAIWAGMTAVPWEGPPPLSLRGFGSVLFQSTMNRELDPAVRSGLANRNYFLVARNFCNVVVRLGYHFSLVEAHVSDLLTENYVSFQFKGGAADENRRFVRVQLLRAILQQVGFRAEQKADALTARIEKKPAPFLLSRLKVLGYLLIHTRQIDMAMDEGGMVERYRQKIMADIEPMLAPELETAAAR